MSINVTVSGNPVSINRGKMVTCDPNCAKKEFEKRRLMRLEQVRQQSKDIAEGIRNKVRREKKKQMSQIEQEAREKLRNWQNRKLLELQTQYKEVLRELGTGHKQAVELEGESEVLEEQKEYNQEIASHRSRVAATQLQIDKNKANLKKSIPIQQKKIVRDIENTRAALVSNIKKKKPGITLPAKKKKKRKKASADINITIPDSDSQSEDEVEELLDLDTSDRDKFSSSAREEDTSNSTQIQQGASCECTEDSEHPRKSLEVNENNLASKLDSQEPLGDFSLRPTTDTNIPMDLRGRNNLTENLHRNLKETSRKAAVDTRISDRIKRREIMVSEPDYCDIVADTHPTPFVESNTQITDAIDARYLKCACPNVEKEDIPSKPPVKLKEVRDQPSKDTLETSKVQFYHHPNRFSQEKRLPAGSHVERITTDSLEVIPNIISEAEWQEKMRQRDKEAWIRGQRALEKERIQKDYEEMMKKLPLLQKKERISEINNDKPEYHMSEERLKERERQKQNRLDNAYSKLFPNYKPTIVTLPSKKHDKDVRKLHDDKPTQSLNVGKWDVDHEQKMFTAEEVQEIIRSFTERQKPQDRQAKLKELLKSLKLQKQQLLKEIKSLPKDDSIKQLINDLNSVSDSDEGARMSTGEKSERKRRREENTDTSESSSSSYTKTERGIKLKDKQKTRRHSESTKAPSPRKKPKIKYKTKVLILQNTSTQTTPKIQSSNSEQDKPKEQPEKKAICNKLHIPCDCNKENEKEEELCQILIKLNDRENPEVVVKSKEIESKLIGNTSSVQEKSPRAKQIASKSIGVGTEEGDVRPSREKVERVSASVAQASVSDGLKKISMRRTKVESKTGKIETRKDKPPQVDSKDSKSKSWKEQLSKNSLSTTSTSYLSPPDFKKAEESQAFTSSSDISKESFYNLRKKPQQGNLHEISAAVSVPQSQSSSGERIIEPTLLRYIKKLLGKSRESIENLTVSTSNVQTPSESVVEMDSNNPMAQLHNLIKYLNLRAETIAQQLSFSQDSSQIHYNSNASSSEISVHLEGNVDQSSKSQTKDSKRSVSSVKSKDSVSQQYADITDSCSKRIATLAAMINQIREEKIQMLQKSTGAEGLDTAEKLKSGSVAGSERDNTTGYLDQPKSKESSNHSSLNSLDDDELHRRLMEIDMSLAKKLRKFSPLQEDGVTKDDGSENKADVADDPNNTEKELQMRLHRLLYQNVEGPPVSSTATDTNDNDVQFVPFLSDIPKLPKLEMQPENDQNTSMHKRPPPSKGLTIAKRFNGNISLVPHELSTIIEADSQVSTKISSSQVSPNASRTSQGVSPRKGFELLVKPDSVVDRALHGNIASKFGKDAPDMVTKVSITHKKSIEVTEDDKPKEKDSKTSSPLNLSYDISSKSITYDTSGNKSTISSAKSLKMSSSSSDDTETIEAMLKSIGMEWAIPTLHKTKEALALTSSSSSLDFSAKKKTKQTESSGSEVSLKEYLKKQVLAKVSSSTLKSDASAGSLLSEFSELSAIQINSSTEKVTRRTSTPVTSSKSTSKSKSFGKRVAFSGDSDISSVKDEPQKQTEKHSFISLNEWSRSKDSKDD